MQRCEALTSNIPAGERDTVTEIRELSQPWILRPLSSTPIGDPGLSIEAQVPGCVHTDLLRNGLIPDPYLDDNENQLSWIGRTDWEYTSDFQFEKTDDERIDLCFDGLDTIASITLNGRPIGSTFNMHRRYRFEVSEVIANGSNTLSIIFRSPLEYSEEAEKTRGTYPHSNPHPYNQIRKMACNFGWDWGPIVPTSGIWRPVRLESWSTARLASVHPRVTVADDAGMVDIEVLIERAAQGTPLTLTASINNQSVSVPIGPTSDHATCRLRVPDVQRWWPRTLGDPHLYNLEVELASTARTLEHLTKRIGFRSVSIDNSPDSIGSKWEISVNDSPLWIRGANWIPDDCFPTRVDSNRYRHRLTQAQEANIDLLRIWGGGIYEDDVFYDLCDELGILVWQDFLFACAAYPEDPTTQSEVEAEARDNVTRLQHHPSLILWNGNNENQWIHEINNWDASLKGRPWGVKYYSEILPGVVAELDGTRPYWPGSPYSDDAHFPNDEDYGNTHIWDVWNSVGYSSYREHSPRFVSEFGFQGPPTMATLRQSITHKPLESDSPLLWHHEKADSGKEKLTRGLSDQFPVPSDFDDWHYLTSVNQARAIQLGIEHLRGLGERCSGAIVWQLNDCWPVISWALVDGYGRLKPVWYAVRNAFSRLHVAIHPSRSSRDALRAHFSNLTQEDWITNPFFRRVNSDGETLTEHRFSLTIPANTDADWPVPADLSVPSDPTREFLVVDTPEMRNLWFWVPDKEFRYPKADLEASAQRTANGAIVSVKAKTLVRDLSLLVDRVAPDSIVDQALVTLLPGESTIFRITNAPGAPSQSFSSSEVLRSVNGIHDLVRGGL